MFALAWANAKATGVQGKGSGNLSLERKLLIVFTPLPPQGGEGKRKGFVFTPTVPLKGEGEKEGFPQGFVEWSGLLLLMCLVMLRGKPLIICLIGRLRQAKPLIVCLIGNLLPGAKALDYIHPACFCLSAENVSPSRGARGLGLVCKGFCQGFEAVVWRGFCTTLFILLANNGAYTFHFYTYLLKV